MATATDQGTVVEFTQLDLQKDMSSGLKDTMQNDALVREFSPLPTSQGLEEIPVGDDLEMGKGHNPGAEEPINTFHGTTRENAKVDVVDSKSAIGTSPIQVISSSNGIESPLKSEKQLVVEPFGVVVQRAAILFLVLLPAFAVFMLAFTEIGFGATVFKYLAGASLASAVGGLGMILFFVLYILDVSYWRGPIMRTLRVILLSVAGLAMIVALILTFRTRPYAPLLGYVVAIWLLCCVLYWRFFSTLHVINYMQSLSICLLFASMIGMLISLIWAGMNDFWWGNETKIEFRARLRVCEDMDECKSYGRFGKACYEGVCVEKEAESACAIDEAHCLASFILFAGQFVISILTFVISFSMLLVSRSIITHQQAQGQGLSPQTKMYGYAVLVLVFMIWIASSIGGASMELSNVVTAFAVTLLAMLIVMVGLTLGKSTRERLKGHGAVKKAMSLVKHDWMKGLAMITISFLFPFLLLISLINQALRRTALGRVMMKEISEDESKQLLTTFGRRIWDSLKAWEWSSVLTKAIILGFAYFVLQVGVGKLTAVFLGWLNDYLKNSGLSFWVISVIIFLIGMLMFLIPAVPGVPVYVTTGVTLGAVGEEYLGNFAYAMLWAILVAFLTKLMACAFQQKIIGEQMGTSVWVKSRVGLNSHAVKAIRLILQRPGLDRGKVMILVGGPDWPTSVLTGILRLPYLGMMIGTLPILLPVAFTVVAGGCMLKTDQGGLWVSMGSLFLTLSALSLGGCLILAAIAIENTVAERKAELDVLPDDPDVKKFDDEQTDIQTRTRAAMAWAGLPGYMRALLVVAWLFMYISFMAFAQFSDVCFESVGVTTVYNEPPLNGNVLNVVKGTVGWGVLGVHGVSLVFWQIFGMWVKHKAKRLPSTTGSAVDTASDSAADMAGSKTPTEPEPESWSRRRPQGLSVDVSARPEPAQISVDGAAFTPSPMMHREVCADASPMVRREVSAGVTARGSSTPLSAAH